MTAIVIVVLSVFCVDLELHFPADVEMAGSGLVFGFNARVDCNQNVDYRNGATVKNTNDKCHRMHASNQKESVVEGVRRVS